MKLGKYILGLAVVLAAGLTSCDTENVGAIYQPKASNITFMLEESSNLTKANNYTVPVTLSRSIINKAYTATVIIEDAYCENADGEVTPALVNVKMQNPQAVFAAGESFATVNVEFINMAPGCTYTCVLGLSDDDVATANEIGSQIAMTDVSVMCDFDWESIPDAQQVEIESYCSRQPHLHLARVVGRGV